MSRSGLSACIITYNEADRIEACLDSVAFCDEIVVVDSHSSDATRELARRRGARVIERDWPGYRSQKQFAIESAAHDWVLCLDADERLTPELGASIRSALAATPSAAAFAVARRNRFLGRWLRHGEGYPDWIVRLFDRRRARWSDTPVHESVVAHGPIVRLSGDLLHESAESLEAYVAKQNRYTTLQASAMRERGEHASFARLLLAPLVRFARLYVVRLGFLDGAAGFAHIAIGCFASFLKYAKLRALREADEQR